MKKVVKVEFKKYGPTDYFLISENDDIKCNDNVVIENEYGIQIGHVVSDIMEIDTTLFKNPLKSIIRKATKKECQINQKNIEEAQKALKVCRKLAAECELNISILDAMYTFSREQLIFHFVAESRVDFRELARLLANKYHTRIELRQIGVRDKAKQVGGIGGCGQPLCCNRFIREFDSVSINMAKNQNIALNPTKINGCCGRLLCCLNYENEIYTEHKKKLPKIGSKVKIEEGTGIVTEVNVLKKTYIVDIPKTGPVTKEVD